jgi:hypothetical protein
MNEIKKIYSIISVFIARIKKVQISLGLNVDPQNGSTKKTFTVEISVNDLCFKCEIHHIKSNAKFHFGIVIKTEKISSELFIFVNNLRLLYENHKYLMVTPICSTEEPSNVEGEMWYTAARQINDEYFSETTTEIRKDEIIKQILTEVIENLDEHYSRNMESN